MKFSAKNIALTLSAAALVAASFNVAAKDDKQAQLKNLAMYQSVAGEPVKSFTHVLRTNVSWQPLGDSNLLYHTTPSKAFLLKLDQSCMDMDFAQAVTISGGNTVHVNTDRVRVMGPTNPGGLDCKITEIRPVDVKAYRALKKSQNK